MKAFLFSLVILFFTSLHSSGQYPGAPDFGQVVNSFNAGILTPTPDRVLFGAEYAEGHIWVNGFDPDDFYQHKLYKFTPDGTLVETYTQAMGFIPWKGLTYDGNYLYMADKDSLTEVSTATGYPTGNHIPVPFNPAEAVTYDPSTDRFWVTGYPTNNIFEIDRQGNIYRVFPKLPERNVLGLAYDSWSPGGPFLWTWSTVITYDSSYVIADQLHIGTGSYTGTKMYGTRQTPNPYSIEYAAGFTMTDQILDDTIVFVALQQGQYQASNDQLDWLVIYNADLRDGAIPGPEISTNPTFLENFLEPGDSAEMVINIYNDGIAGLNWSARIEGMQPPGDSPAGRALGDTLLTFDASALTPDNDTRLSGIEFINNSYWITGRGNPGSNFKKIYRINSTGNALIGSSNQAALYPTGWSAITSDGNFLYGSDQYGIIREYDIDSLKPTDNFIFHDSFYADAMTYDPQKDHFWLGNGNGAILEIDRQGNEINFFLTEYDIEGMAWDEWSPGGPYLWVWSTDTSLSGALATAYRLDPETTAATGVSFPGLNLSGDPGQPDEAEAATITRDLFENKLVFVALHNSNDSLDKNDRVAVYDLDVVPPPEWIELTGPTHGTVPPGDAGTLTVKMKAIMNDTVMTAGIKITSNDIINPEILIPVNVTMQFITSVNELDRKNNPALGQNEPNPFNDRTRVRFYVPGDQKVTLRLYDAAGNLLSIPLDRNVMAGTHDLYIDANSLPAGIYYYTLTGAGFSLTKKMIISR